MSTKDDSQNGDDEDNSASSTPKKRRVDDAKTLDESKNETAGAEWRRGPAWAPYVPTDLRIGPDGPVEKDDWRTNWD